MMLSQLRRLDFESGRVTFELVENVGSLIQEGFSRKFGGAPPSDDWPFHICAFWSPSPGMQRLAGYVHFGRFGDTCLVGGMFTDGRVIRDMPESLRKDLAKTDGLAVSMLKFGFNRLADDFDAFFGLVEDPRALEVDLAAGFKRTEHKRLVVYTPKDLQPFHVRCLQAKVLELGEF